LIESILAVAAIGVVLGVAIALAFTAVLGGNGSPAIETAGSDTGTTLVFGGPGIGGSQGVLTQAGELVGPGEGLNAASTATSEPATARTSLGTSNVDEILVGPGQGLNEHASAGTMSAPVGRPAGPGEGLMEQGLVHAGATGAAGESDSIGRNLIHPSGGLIGPGEGMMQTDFATSTGVPIERPFGPGEGLVNGDS
jgi:hypothetical protein